MPPEDTNTDTDPATDPPAGDPPANDPPEDDWKSPESKAAALADLMRERNERKALQAEIDQLKTAQLSDQEKAIKKAREEAEAETSGRFQTQIARQALKAAAVGKFADPSDAAVFVNIADIKFDANGDPDEKALAAAVDAVLKAKPHLAASAPRSPLPGSQNPPANAGGSGNSLNERIRQAAGRS